MWKVTRLLSTSLILLLTSCAGLNIYSDEELEPLSVQAYAEASAAYPEVTSGKDYQMVQEVAQRIAAVAGENFPWEAKLLQADEVPNAFCLPNGRIAVYTGILPLTKNIDGLAAVLGHEVAHATLRHGGQRMTSSQLNGMAMVVVNAGLDMTDLEPTTKEMTMMAIGAVGQYGMMLPYSRDHETEADIWGIRYAIRAGFNPNEAPKLWERMAELGGSTPEWMSTHPDPLERAKKLRAVIPRIIREEKDWPNKTSN